MKVFAWICFGLGIIALTTWLILFFLKKKANLVVVAQSSNALSSNKQFSEQLEDFRKELMTEINNSVTQIVRIYTSEKLTTIINNTKTGSGNSTIFVNQTDFITSHAGVSMPHGTVVINNDSDNKIYPFNTNNLSHSGKALGILWLDASSGQECVVQVAGKVFIRNWGLTAHTRYFIGANGQLTTVVPTAGISQSAGVAIDDMNFRIEFGDVTILNN